MCARPSPSRQGFSSQSKRFQPRRRASRQPSSITRSTREAASAGIAPIEFPSRYTVSSAGRAKRSRTARKGSRASRCGSAPDRSWAFPLGQQRLHQTDLHFVAGDQAFPARLAHRGVTPGDQRHEARALVTAGCFARHHARHDPRCERLRIRSHVVVDDQPRGIADRPVEHVRPVEERPATEEIPAHPAGLERPERPAADFQAIREERVGASRRHGALGGDTVRELRQTQFSMRLNRTCMSSMVMMRSVTIWPSLIFHTSAGPVTSPLASNSMGPVAPKYLIGLPALMSSSAFLNSAGPVPTGAPLGTCTRRTASLIDGPDRSGAMFMASAITIRASYCVCTPGPLVSALNFSSNDLLNASTCGPATCALSMPKKSSTNFAPTPLTKSMVRIELLRAISFEPPSDSHSRTMVTASLGNPMSSKDSGFDASARVTSAR